MSLFKFYPDFCGNYLEKRLLFEITVVEALESFTVTCLVLSHLVDCVVDGVEVAFLGVACDAHFVFAGSAFGDHTFLEVGLGVPDDFSEEFGEFGAVFGFFEGVAFEGFGDFRIAFAVGLAAHSEIHSDFRRLAEEVCVEVLNHFVAGTFGDADFVFGDKVEA